MMKKNYVNYPNEWTQKIDYPVIEENAVFSTKTLTDFKFDFLEVTSFEWQIGVIHILDGFVSFRVGGHTHTIRNGNYGFYFPPFSIINYSGFYKKAVITTLMSQETIPDMPQTAIGFIPAANHLSESLEDAVELVRQVRNSVILNQNPAASKISLQIKEQIEKHYLSSFSFKNLASEVKVSQELISMYFKQNFNLTPVQYRTRLRIVKAIDLLLRCRQKNMKIIDIAGSVGFNDLSHFNRQFKYYTGVTPGFFLSIPSN